MKILIKESQYKVLLEQSVDNTPNVIYGKIVNAVAGLGTNINGLLEALKLLKSPEQFKQLLSLFKDKKTGYDSFESMIDGEFESDNVVDFIDLENFLRKIGISIDRDIYSSDWSYRIKIKKFTYPTTKKTPNKYLQQVPPPTPKTLQQVPKECSSKWQPQLEKAKNYWIKWLSDDITRIKFLNNWQKVEKNMTLVEVGNIFKKYIDSLKVLKLYYYNSKLMPKNANSYAFVNRFEPDKIYVNCSQNDPDPYGSLIHEIQHMLYDIKPLNPDVQIGNVFVDSNTKKSTPKTFFKGNSNSNDYDVTNKIISASKKFGVPITTLTYLLSDAEDYDKKDPGYSCRETEKMSNIMAIRSLFGVNPGQNITEEMLSPYINGKKNNTNVTWVLYCWALKGFPDLNEMLNKMNQLAYQNTKKDTFNPLNPIKNQNNNSNTRTV